MAAPTAGQNPPISAVITTMSRYALTSLANVDSPRNAERVAVVATSSTAPTRIPVSRRRRVNPYPNAGSPRPRPAKSWLTMCVSIGPDRRVTTSPVPGPSTDAYHRRRLAPSTTWVASTLRANSSSASGMRSPTTE